MLRCLLQLQTQRGPKTMKRCIGVRLSLFFVFLLLSFMPARAQEMIKSPETNVSERVRLLESELERQNSKLDQLQKTLIEQQALIQALLDKLNAQPSAAVTTVKEPEPVTASAPAEPQTPTVEQRLAKVEGQVLKVGPVKLSGDFRLRFDGTFRSATEPPDPPLGNVQNARAPYRFRLNLHTDLYPNLSFHAQLATGPLNNQLSTNQDFTSIAVRAPFALSEAWIEYRPTKAWQLQGGRVLDVFADDSRFLFDDDLRFNGFNERYTHTFKANGTRVSSLELRAGQYILSTPNDAVIAPNSPLARAGEVVGTTGRSATLFHQGLLVNQKFNEHWGSQFGGDIQLYNHPNQIALASTQAGLVLLVQPVIGIRLSGSLACTETVH